MLVKALILAALGLAAVAIADNVIVTETPGVTVLHSPDGTAGKTFKTHKECVDSIPVDSTNTCWDSTVVKKVGVCDPAPTDLPAGTVAEGVATVCPNDPNRWYTRVTGYVSHYPKCNVVGLVPETPPPSCTGDLPPNAWDQNTIWWVPPVDPGGMQDPDGNPVK